MSLKTFHMVFGVATALLLIYFLATEQRLLAGITLGIGFGGGLFLQFLRISRIKPMQDRILEAEEALEPGVPQDF